ncbi:hypothetical protein [Lewinella sp. IMCC34183]|uniref:hypothetical protein n=1 Tax=Lewinella sp. IMCC34183 TaxID=2248762 RepID=UPI0013003C71|nr:hypothetical protein [Lewinella sp. IMCC34183]
MLEFVYQNVYYPEEAKEGMAGLSVMAERDGSLFKDASYRDPGYGIGRDVLPIARLVRKSGRC